MSTTNVAVLSWSELESHQDAMTNKCDKDGVEKFYVANKTKLQLEDADIQAIKRNRVRACPRHGMIKQDVYE